MTNKQNQTGRTGGRTTLETLNRARLDALGSAMQASHLLEAAKGELDQAQNLFLKSHSLWEKADKKFLAYLKREQAAHPGKKTTMPNKGGRHG